MNNKTKRPHEKAMIPPAWRQPLVLTAALLLWLIGLLPDGAPAMILHALGCVLLTPGLAWPGRGGAWTLWIEPGVQTAAALTALLTGAGVVGLLWLLSVRVLAWAARLYDGLERRKAAARLDTLPDKAQVFRDGQQQTIPAAQVRPGEPVIVPPDSVIPVDATVVKGESLTGLSPLTAGADMRSAAAGDMVLAGCRNETGLLAVKAVAVGEDTLTRAWRRQTLAAAEKAPALSGRLRLALLLWAALVAGMAVVTALFAPGAGAGGVPPRVAAVALTAGGVAMLIPLALLFRRGIVHSAERGVRLDGPDILWSLAGVKTVILGRSGLQASHANAVTGLRLAAGADRDTLLRCAAIAMMETDSPTGHSVIDYCGDVGYPADRYEHSDGGVAAYFSGHVIHAGSAGFLRGFGIDCEDTPHSALCVALDNRELGALLIADALRDGAEALAAELKRRGVDLALITSAPRVEAGRLGERLGIADIHAEIAESRTLPIVRELFSENKGHAAYLGSALTDAALLKAVPAGLCVDGLETVRDAVPCAVVLPGASPEKLGALIKQARSLRRFALTALAVTLAVKLGCITLSFMGFLPATAVIGIEAALCLALAAAARLRPSVRGGWGVSA